jgi:hypothetical protein
MKSLARRSRLSVGTIAALALAVDLAASPAHAQPILNEGFGSTSFQSPTGWVVFNNSQFADPNQTWGNPGTASGTGTAPFSAQQGGPSTFIGVSDLSSTGQNTNLQPVPAVISNWLITPQLGLTPNSVLTFWTRTITANTNGDRLQVWLNPTGTQNAGPTTIQGTPNTTPGDQIPPQTGDFTVLALDINPNEVATGQPGAYPENWTQFTVSLSSLTGVPTGPFTGRFGFRYFAEDGGPNGDPRPLNHGQPFTDYVGIDSVTVNAVPEPTSLALVGVALPALAWTLRRRRPRISG